MLKNSQIPLPRNKTHIGPRRNNFLWHVRERDADDDGTDEPQLGITAEEKERMSTTKGLTGSDAWVIFKGDSEDFTDDNLPLTGKRHLPVSDQSDHPTVSEEAHAVHRRDVSEPVRVHPVVSCRESIRLSR